MINDLERKGYRVTSKLDVALLPLLHYFKENGITNVEVIALGSSDPQDKADWIEQQAQKGWNDIRFMDDSSKNVSAVREMAKNYPDINWLIKKVRIH